MDHDEEQRNEIEALEAIFDADFTVTSAEVPRSFELVLVPNADGSNNHVAARLLVSLPAKYPEDKASVRIRGEKGLNERQMETLQTLVADKLDESDEGEVVVYNVAEAVREYLCENNQPVLSMYEQMQARSNAKSSEEEEALAKRRALEERIEAKKKEPSPLGIEPGTLLTPESFAHWRALFDAEQMRIRMEKEALRPRMDRLTGKQLFMQNLAKDLGDDEADRLEEEEPTPLPSGAGAVPVGAQVFCFNDDLFTEDLDDDEEGAGGDHAVSDDDDEEGDEDEGMAGMFDTTTDAQRQLAGASISASSASAVPASASSSSAAAPKKPAAAASSSSSSAAAPAARSSPPGFGAAAAASSSSAKPAQPQQQQQPKAQQPQAQPKAAPQQGKQQQPSGKQQQAPPKGGDKKGGAGGKKK